ncbi:hypothetical protein [Ornithinibacillus xuwenensis]|uniref:Uncharacterized protein n=1 Tax=Ornithinibacillus xuwenensis TaxID=3144668 RepID=A0ABU9XDD4_9BACI
MKPKKLLIITSIVFVIVLILAFGTLKQASVHNFPIPINAKVDEERSNNHIIYSYIGINSIYVNQVKLFGWKEIDRLGSKRIFEKDGKRVAVTTFKEGFHISATEGQ